MATSGRKKTYTHEVRVANTYEVEGVTLRGTRHDAAGHLRATSRANADALARGRAVGSEVTVHYDPDDPASAVLALSGARRGWMRTGFGAVLVICGVWFGLRRLRN